MNCRKGIFEKRMVDNFIVLIKGRHSLSGIMNLLSTEKKKKGKCTPRHMKMPKR